MKKFSLFLLGAILISGCAGTDPVPAPETLADIYKRAYAEYADENYAGAAAEFITAENNFPSSEYAADALIMAAYSQYMDGDFAGALLTTDRFMRFHPGHSDVAYVLYLRGMCYYRQVSDVRRDPGMSAYALTEFEQLTTRFPKSPYAENAKNKIVILKNYIAGKAMYAARRDMQRENWTSAITKLQSVVSGAAETQMAPEALFRLREAYTAIGLPEQASGYGEMLRKNYPDNVWTQKLN
ncbi:MAG: outer membrane protein assembly factor BamD [Rickettsiales bacterium]|jgi:outer membrane protein assembly factor BamD|nr:outer membrane protein assembly factor BamD [Rickettsiales bacterium]